MLYNVYLCLGISVDSLYLIICFADSAKYNGNW